MKKVLSTLILATLVLSVVAVAGVVPVRSDVVGQLEVSTKQFWGNAVVQVRLYDPDLNANPNQRDSALLSVKIESANGSVSTYAVYANESLVNSGEFYFYFANASAAPIDSTKVKNAPYKNEYYNVTWELKSGDKIIITYTDSSPLGTRSETVTYKEYMATSADMSFDRATREYPMNGYIKVYVKDPDWNLDPTSVDKPNLNITFWNYTGSFLGCTVVCEETEPNSSVFMFEVSYNTTNAFAGDLNFVGVAKSNPVKVQYENETTPPYLYITLKEFPVTLLINPTFTTSGDLLITVRDPNLNFKSWAKENLESYLLNTYVNVSMGNDFVILSNKLVETDVNTGEFQFKLPVFLAISNTGDTNLQVEVNQTKATIKYYVNGSTTPKAETISTLSTTPATITTDKSMYRRDGTVKITINAPDINDDTNNPNYFTCGLPDNNATISKLDVVYNGQIVGKLTIKVNGLLARTDADVTLTFLEDAVDSGKFVASMSLEKIYRNDNSTLQNGDSLVISYYDAINDATSSAPFTIGIAPASIHIDRETYPVPYDGAVNVYITVTDSESNTDSNTIQEKTAYVDVYLYNATIYSTYDDFPVTLKETGPDTGIFKGTFTLPQSPEKALINGRIKVFYYDLSINDNITKTANLRATDSLLTLDKKVVKAGDILKITVKDPDANRDSKDTDFVTVHTDIPGKPTLTLTETGEDTGVFTASLTIGSDVILDPGTKMKFKYYDNTPSTITPEYGYPPSSVEYTETATWATFNGEVQVDKSEYGLGSYMKITVIDPDLNNDITTKQSVNVTLRIEGIGDEPVTLKEDGPNSSTFKATYQWGIGANLIGKKFMVYYRDLTDANGDTVVRVATGTVKSWDGEVAFNKLYYDLGEVAVIVVTDPDANLDPEWEDLVNVTVVSDSDPLGQKVTATEKGPNTGVFEAFVQISDSFETGKVFAKLGDTLTASYKDKYPADYATTEKPKTFTGTAAVGVPIARPVPASAQKFVDPNTGAEVTTGRVGQAVMLQATLKNVDATSKSFTAIFKVKDSAGVTIFISWVTGTLAAGQELTPAVSWTPSAAGTYTVEVLVVKSLAEPTPYSDPLSATLTVA